MKAILLAILAFAAVSCQEVSDKSHTKPVLENSALQLSLNNDISGTYSVINEDTSVKSCTFSILLKQENTGYSYQLITDKRNIKGKTNFQQEDGSTLLTLEGIQWDEYEGDISNENKATKEEPELPEGVVIQVKNDTISIQNYCNAMNSYTIFSECSKKFIRLAKQKNIK